MELINKQNNTTLLLIFISIITIISLVFKINIIILIEAAIVGTSFFVYIWKDAERLLIFSVILSIMSSFLSEIAGPLAHLPQILVILLVFKLGEKILIKKELLTIDKMILFITMGMFLLDSTSYLINTKGNMVLYIWTIVKKYNFFIVYIYILNLKNFNYLIKKLNNLIKLMLYIQFIWTFVQFKSNVFFDDITGIFGSRSTGEYATFLMIYFTILINKKNKDKKDGIFISFLSVHILIYSVIAEVKLLMILFPMIILISFLIKRKKILDIVYIAIISALLSTGYNVYLDLYPEQAVMNIGEIDRYLTKSYGVHTDINRLGFIEPLEKSGLLEKRINKMFGNGLGIIHPSDRSMVKGPLYDKYRYLKIEWFTLPYIVTESGIIGAILFVSIYVVILLRSLSNIDTENGKCLLCISIISLVIIIYNSSMITSMRIPIFIWTWIGLLTKSRYNLKVWGEVYE